MGAIIFSVIFLAILVETTVTALSPLYYELELEYPLLQIPYVLSFFASAGYTYLVNMNIFASWGVTHGVGVALTSVIIAGVAGYINRITNREMVLDDEDMEAVAEDIMRRISNKDK